MDSRITLFLFMEFLEQAWPFSETGEGSFNHQTTADLNRLRVLGLLVRRKCRSQRELTVTTGLRASTVSNIVRDMKSWGIVREGEPMDAERVGPKETELEMVGSAAWSVGVHLFGGGQRLTIVNAMGHVLASEASVGDVEIGAWMETLPKTIGKLTKQLGLNPSRLGGIGVTIPGVVDSGRGEILISRSLKVHSFPVSAPLRRALKCPVWVERDVVCGAYAEHYAGEVQDRPSFIYLMIRNAPEKADAFGLALVVEERLFRGCHSAAGEIDRNFLSNCQFEVGASERDSDDSDIFYKAFGASVGSIVNLLDVGCGVICCDDPAFTPERFSALHESVCGSLIPVPGRMFELRRSGMGHDGVVLGAALLASHRQLASRLGAERAAAAAPRKRGVLKEVG